MRNAEAEVSFLTCAACRYLESRFETVSTHRMAGPSLPPQSLERSVVKIQVGSRDGLIERQVALLGVEEANAITKCCVPGELNEYEGTIARYEWILLIAKETTQKRGTTGKVSQRWLHFLLGHLWSSHCVFVSALA